MRNRSKSILKGVSRLMRGVLMLPVIIVIVLAMYITQKKGKRIK